MWQSSRRLKRRLDFRTVFTLRFLRTETDNSYSVLGIQNNFAMLLLIFFYRFSNRYKKLTVSRMAFVIHYQFIWINSLLLLLRPPMKACLKTEQRVGKLFLIDSRHNGVSEQIVRPSVFGRHFDVKNDAHNVINRVDPKH